MEWLPLVVLTAVSLVGVAALTWGVLELRLAYRIYANEPIPVMETTGEGAVEVEGTVEPAVGVLESPFTETPCVAYEYAVEEKRTHSSSTGKTTSRRTTWTEIDSGSAVVPFRVADDTGSALVEPAGADLRLSSERATRVRGGEEPPTPIAQFIRANEDVTDENRSIGIGPLEFATGRDRRYKERRLDVGGPVHVLGTARFDTNVGREAGTVNAVIGADGTRRRDGLGGLIGSLLFSTPFLVSDTTGGRTALRVALSGLGAVLVSLVLFAFGLLLFVG